MKRNSSDIFLHVGLPKTGTTWIQREIFSKLDLQYIRYMYMYSHIHENTKTLLSMESLSGVPDVHPYETRFQVLDRLKRLFPDANIIVGIRDKQQWIRSAYNQYVKGGGMHPWNHWRNNLFDERYLDFEYYIKKLRQSFHQVFVYSLEEIRDDADGFAKKICEFIDEPVPKYSKMVHNKSLSSNQLEAQRILNTLLKSEVNPHGLLPETIGNLERTVVRRIRNG